MVKCYYCDNDAVTIAPPLDFDEEGAKWSDFLILNSEMEASGMPLNKNDYRDVCYAHYLKIKKAFDVALRQIKKIK